MKQQIILGILVLMISITIGIFLRWHDEETKPKKQTYNRAVIEVNPEPYNKQKDSLINAVLDTEPMVSLNTYSGKDIIIKKVRFKTFQVNYTFEEARPYEKPSSLKVTITYRDGHDMGIESYGIYITDNTIQFKTMGRLIDMFHKLNWEK